MRVGYYAVMQQQQRCGLFVPLPIHAIAHACKQTISFGFQRAHAFDNRHTRCAYALLQRPSALRRREISQRTHRMPQRSRVVGRGRGVEYAGSNAGRSVTQGNTTRHYDKTGKTVGKSVTQGNTTRTMDSSGKTVGKSTTTGSTTVHKDAQGRTTGKTVTK